MISKKMDTVQVLMSTYQGARYLPQQMESILSQKGVKVSLLIRDDGSKDRTLEILKSYEKRYQNILVYTGCRRGAAGSFYDLLEHADLSFAYYAFADQDDVWNRDKLFRAVSMLKMQTESLPLLYAGKVIYASENLDRRQSYPYSIRHRPSFGNALMENICMGCTEVFNGSLLKLVREHLPPDRIMHDWWMYLTAAYFGKVLYDQRAYMLYRQHGNNEIGMQDRWSRRWLQRIRNIHQMKHKLSEQAEAFQGAYADTFQSACAERLEIDESLYLLCNYRGSFGMRCKIARDQHLYRQNVLDDAICRLLFMIGFL